MVWDYFKCHKIQQTTQTLNILFFVRRNKISYQIQENRPAYNMFHDVWCFEFFMRVWSKRYKEISSSYGEDVTQEGQTILL